MAQRRVKNVAHHHERATRQDIRRGTARYDEGANGREDRADDERAPEEEDNNGADHASVPPSLGSWRGSGAASPRRISTICISSTHASPLPKVCDSHEAIK